MSSGENNIFEDQLPSPDPLTFENLQRHDPTVKDPNQSNPPTDPSYDIESTAAQLVSNPSPPSQLFDLDFFLYLEAHNIHKTQIRPLPRGLKLLVNQAKTRRVPTEVWERKIAQNSRSIVDLHRYAQTQNKDDGMDALRPYLLPPPAFRLDRVPLIDVCLGALLSEEYFPVSRDPAAQSQMNHGGPQPDTSIGYMSDAYAKMYSADTPFTREEELVLTKIGPVCHLLQIPFFTCEWESPESGVPPMRTVYKGARHGAIMVNYLRELYHFAHPDKKPDVTDSCHFSGICDMTGITVFVHWFREDEDGEDGHYEMTPILDANFSKEKEVKLFLKLLHNIIEHSCTSRLQSIRDTLPILKEQIDLGILGS